MAWQSFHQFEALTTRLSNILEEYPPGVSTLREYVQNADDAKATTLTLCLDCTADGGANLAAADANKFPTPELANHAGPALLVYNDAQFSERDFDSISSIGKSRKKDDGTSIGRYGLGFNVSYHFSDVVQFVSGSTVVLFDPHGRSLPDKQLGMRATYTDGLGAQYPGLLGPLLVPLQRFARDGAGDAAAASPARAVDYSSPVGGTLFRLPLRTDAQASASELSSRAVSTADVRSLLTSLCDSGLGEMLLFTQNLKEIVCCVIEPSGEICRLGAAVVDDQPPKALTMGAAAAARNSRAALANLAKDPDATPTVDAPLVFELSVRVEEYPAATSGGTVPPQAGCTTSHHAVRRHEHWLLCGGALKDDESGLLAAALGQPAAWGAVALPLHGAVVGRAFSFLPLPLLTALPCHVNGCFALTSNRRELWTEDADRQLTDQHNLRKARWNQLLCSRALPQLYSRALEPLAADESGAWPRQRLGELLPLASGASVPQAALWRSLQHATLAEVYTRRTPLCACYGAAGSVRLTPLADVVLSDAAIASSPAFQALRHGLCVGGMRLWAAPPGAAEALAAAEKPIRRARPASVCEWLSAIVAEGDLPEWWSVTLSAQLLAYVLDPTEHRGGETGQHEAVETDDHEDNADDDALRLVALAAPLIGLPVIPLTNGSLGTLHGTGRTERTKKKQGKGAKNNEATPGIPRYALANAEAAALMPGCRVLVDAGKLDEHGFQHLRALANSQVFNLIPRLTASFLLRPECMEVLLPSDWHGTSIVTLCVTSDDGVVKGEDKSGVGTEENAQPSPRGWQPKGKFSGSKKAAKIAKPPPGSFRKAGASHLSAAVATPRVAAAADEAAISERLALLWRLVDEASVGGVGEWAALELGRLDEWPTVLTSEGNVVSIGNAKVRPVLRATAFASDDAARSVLCRFGCRFAVHDSHFLNRRVCHGPERIGVALEAACSDKKLQTSSAATTGASLPLDVCLALRRVVLSWCVQQSQCADGAGTSTMDTFANGEDIPSRDATGSDADDDDGLRPVAAEDVPREATPRVPLSSAILRKLPIFMALDGTRCFALRTSHSGSAGAAIGTPGDGDPYQPTTSLDEALQPVMGDGLLSYATDDERTLLRLADWPRAGASDLVRLLLARLRLQARAASSDARPLELPLAPSLLLLAAAGSTKEARELGPSERESLVRTLAEVPIVVMPNGERRRAAEFVDPTDELLAQAMRATSAQDTSDGGSAAGEGGAMDGDTSRHLQQQDVETNSGSMVTILGRGSHGFPPAEYTSSPHVVAGLRSCGMRSLNEPNTFLEVAASVERAGQEFISDEAQERTAAVGLALLRMLIERWSRLGGEMSQAQMTTLKRTCFVPCLDVRRLLLPSDRVQPPNAKLLAKLGSGQLHGKATDSNNRKGGKKGKGRHGGGSGTGGGGGGGGGGSGEGWQQIADDFEAAQDAIHEDQNGAPSELGKDELDTRRLAAMQSIGSWWTSQPAARRAELAHGNAAGGGPVDNSTGTAHAIVWASLGSGSACLEADAWLAWTQLLILPKCLNFASANALSALGVMHPLPSLVVLRHLARVTAQWRSQPASWRGQLSVPVMQGLSFLCCYHAFTQMPSDGIVSGSRGGPLSSAARLLSAQSDQRSECRRTLASAPFVVLSDGSLIPGRHVCVDLFDDLGPQARATPPYLAPLSAFLVDVGGALTSAALAAPEVAVTAPNPFDTLFPQIMAHWDDPTLADVVFDFGGDGKVFAHKLVLALSSPTFAAMFSGGSFAEGQGGMARIDMCDPASRIFGRDALRLALCFMYTGEIPLAVPPAAKPPAAEHGGGRLAPLTPTSSGVSRLLELLLVADYMQHSHMKQTCEKLLIDWEVLQVENVVSIFEHAVGASCAQLRASCVQYMRGMFDVVSASEGWARLCETYRKEVTTLQ